MNRLAILGASGHGKVVAETAELSGWEFIDFFDDVYPRITEIGKWSVIGTSWDLLSRKSEYCSAHVAIGNNAIREEKTNLLYDFKLASIIHPSALISPSVKLGPGICVLGGSVINAYSSIGKGVVINTGASVDHDCYLHNFVHISPGVNLAGEVIIGERSWIGIGSCVIQCLSIGKDVVVGAGSVVINDTESSVLVAGVPGKIKKIFKELQ
ncbi:acetyltransferase [Alphaproteobacteria bacterium]|nr:acetyltransferase [Alphaproteobacteria bacterium]